MIPIHWRYKITEKLGEGGTSTVHRALDLATGGEVALKVAPAELGEILRMEFRRLHRLRHPGLIQAYDFIRTDDQALLSLELLEVGGACPEPGDFETWLRFWSQMASVLGHLHSKGLAHGDIKPENMGRAGDRFKLMDLGFSGRAPAGADKPFVGTPAYASPEALEGWSMAPPGDIYSLGLVLWESAGGALPAPAEKLDPSEAWLEKMPASLPDRAADIVRGMLRYRRLDRIGDGIQLAWAMAMSGFYRNPGLRATMPLAGRCHDLLRAMRAVRGGARRIFIQALPGTGATRFLGELKHLLQIEGHEACLMGQDGRLPPGAASDCWRLYDSETSGAPEAGDNQHGRSIAVIDAATESGQAVVRLTDLGPLSYQRILGGMFPGLPGRDLQRLAGWMHDQVGGHVASFRILLDAIISAGWLGREKQRWKIDWQSVLGLDEAKALDGRWEGTWRRLDDGQKMLLKRTALSGSWSPSSQEEGEAAELGEWLRKERGSYRFIGQAVRGFVLDRCSAEECGKAEDGDRITGKAVQAGPVLKTLARAGQWDAWRKLGLERFRQARDSGDFESVLFYGRMLAGSGRLDDHDLAWVLAETAMSCRALGRYRQGLELLAGFEASLKPDWSLERARIVLQLGAGELGKASDSARQAAERWAKDKTKSLEAGLFEGLAEGMAGGRDKGEPLIAAIESQAAELGLTGLQRQAREFLAMLAHLAGDWNSVVEHAGAGLRLTMGKIPPEGSSNLIGMLGNALVRLNRAAEAEERLAAFLEACENKIPSSDLRSIQAARGEANIRLANWDLAYRCFIEAEQNAGGKDDINLQAFIVSNLAIVLGARNQHRAEAEKHLEAYRLYRESGDLGNALVSLGNYGVKKKALGQSAEAFGILQECLEASRKSGLENVRILASKNLGLAEFEERRWGRALELFQESRKSAEAAGMPLNFEAELFTGLTHVMTGETVLAAKRLDQASKLAKNRPQEIWIEYMKGMIMSYEEKDGLGKALEAVGRMREQGRSREAALMALTAAESAVGQNSENPMGLLAALLEAEAEFGRLGDIGMRDRARLAVVRTARELVAGQGAAAGQGMLDAFYQLAFLLKSGAGPGQVGQAALEQAVKLTEAERGGLFLMDEDGKPELVAGANLDQTTIQDACEFSAKALGQAGREGAEVVSNDAQAEDDFRSRESVRRNAIRSLACLPLQFREGAGGALYLDSRLKPGIFSAGRRQFLKALAAVVGAMLESSRLMEELRQGGEHQAVLRRMIGASAPVAEMKQRIRKAAGAGVNVLIEGETGTGKELAARAVHELSDRRHKPFIALDCGSLPETLLEAELFGYVKGAFTGAYADKPGLFEAADGGTMFLDEITSASLSVQARLLRVIEEGEIRRVGDTRVRKVDVRLICAANKDMEFEMGEGRFKPDLYYRLNEFHIAIPPLRDRGRDILILAEHFKAKHQRRHGKRGLEFSSGAKKAMALYPWPGNIREMENAVQKAVIMAGQGPITEQDLELPAVAMQVQESGDRRKKGVTRQMLSAALRDTGNDTAKAAKKLGVSQRHVQRLIKSFRLAT